MCGQRWSIFFRSNELNKDERKRIEKLQEDSKKGKLGGGAFNSASEITAFDLHLLLAEDAATQKLIRDICKKLLKKAGEAEPDEAEADAPSPHESEEWDTEASDAHHAALAQARADKAHLQHSLAAEQAQRQTAQAQAVALQKEVKTLQAQEKQLLAERRELAQQLKAVSAPTPRDALREQLAPELALLKAVQADAELSQAWLHTDSVGSESEARQLVRLLAVLGDWDELQTLWIRLADHCKQGRRPATSAELLVLTAALALHNLRYRDRAATLVQPEAGSPFHHETMERGTPKGSTVQAVWLPGLRNAAGQLQKLPLVQTGA